MKSYSLISLFLLIIVNYCFSSNIFTDEKYNGKIRFIVIQPSYSQTIGYQTYKRSRISTNSIGGVLNFGFIQNNKYYGLECRWVHGERSFTHQSTSGSWISEGNWSDFFGIGFVNYFNDILYKIRGFSISPGYSLGMWDRRTRDPFYLYKDDLFFLAPKIKFQFGSLNPHFTLEYSLFIGNGLENAIDGGIYFKF